MLIGRLGKALSAMPGAETDNQAAAIPSVVPRMNCTRFMFLAP
jgi:hypothetical protein